MNVYPGLPSDHRGTGQVPDEGDHPHVMGESLMAMISRERVLAALSRETADRVPYCELHIDRALAELGSGALGDDEELQASLGRHLRAAEAVAAEIRDHATRHAAATAALAAAMGESPPTDQGLPFSACFGRPFFRVF